MANARAECGIASPGWPRCMWAAPPGFTRPVARCIDEVERAVIAVGSLGVRAAAPVQEAEPAQDGGGPVRGVDGRGGLQRPGVDDERLVVVTTVAEVPVQDHGK